MHTILTLLHKILYHIALLFFLKTLKLCKNTNMHITTVVRIQLKEIIRILSIHVYCVENRHFFNPQMLCKLNIQLQNSISKLNKI